LERHQIDNQARHGIQPDVTPTSINPHNFNQLNRDTIIAAKVAADDMEAYCDILTRCHSPNSVDFYEPTIVTGTYKIQKEQVIHLVVHPTNLCNFWNGREAR